MAWVESRGKGFVVIERVHGERVYLWYGTDEREANRIKDMANASKKHVSGLLAEQKIEDIYKEGK